MVTENKQRLKYVISDYVMSSLAWFVYNCLRFAMGGVVGFSSFTDFITSNVIVTGQIIFPLIMMLVYYLSGYYNKVFRKSRVQELTTTLFTSAINALIIFFIALINDLISNRTYNYELIAMLWLLIFVAIYIPRCLITNSAAKSIRLHKWSFNTLIIGCGDAAVAFVNRLEHSHNMLGYNVVGFIPIDGEKQAAGVGKPIFAFNNIKKVCDKYNVKELIVVPSCQDSDIILNAINKLFPLNLPIKIAPDKYNLLVGRIKLYDLYGDPLVDISSSTMGESEKNIKRVGDIIISLIVLVLLLPLFLILAILIKLDSDGPVFYAQERIGLHNKPFKIYKFRTMAKDAESDGKPKLSSDDDKRITKVGHFLRKYRIDELPQFWNVLKGDMSIVGPRPERQYFIDEIIKHEPCYALLHKVRPGITSMGMIKFGYAKNVQEMIDRLNYDLLYLENMSLANDIKIMIYTIKIVLTGKGV